MIDKRLLAEARIARLHLVSTVGLGFLVGVVVVLQAFLLSRVVDGAFLGHRPWPELRPLLLGLVVMALLRSVLGWGRDVSSHGLARLVKADLRARVLDRIVGLGPGFSAGERSGELTTTVVEGVEALDAYFSEYLPQLALAVVMPLTILVCILPLDWISGLVLLLTAPLIPLFMVLIGSAADALARRQWVTLSRLSAHFVDVLQGLDTLKLFGRSGDEVARMARISDQYRRTTMGVLRVAFLSSMALEMLATLSVAIVAVEIGLRVLYGRMVFADAFFILVLAPDFYAPLRLLGSRFHSGMAGVAAADRIFEILGAASATADRSGPHGAPSTPVPDLRGATIRFQDVVLRYDPQRRPALDGVSFQLRPAQRLALVGPSGAGKSSVLQLLLRFAAPSEGAITVGDVDLQSVAPGPWREQLAWVPQRPYLFNTTVADNIRLGRFGAPQRLVEEAARRAGAEEFIRGLPSGYETLVGERGSRLSAGQLQRLALARAFLRDAPLVLLDEATANLDPETEELVQEALQELLHQRTALVVAHRLTTVTDADVILVMDAGRIVEEGDHGELMRAEGSGGLYRRLVQAYGGAT